MAAKTRERQALDRNIDLSGKYRKIGITAVAAAVEYQGARYNADRRPEDTARAASHRKTMVGAKPRERSG